MNRLLLTALCLALLVSAISPSALAAAVGETCESEGLAHNCVTETVTVREYRPAYDNGLSGTVNASNVTTTGAFATWTSSWPILGGATVALPEGVAVGGLFETPARVFAAANGTTTPNATFQPLLTNLVYASGWNKYDGPEQSAWGLLTAAYSYTFRLDPKVVMSGSGEWLYRSALKWDATNLSALYIEIKDDAGRTVWAGGYDEEIPPYGLNGNESKREGDRVYFRATAPLFSARTYAVTEYVRTVAAGGSAERQLPHLDFYIAPGQDATGDGIVGFTAFPLQAATRSMTEDPAVSFRFTYGMGPGGTMNLIEFNPGEGTEELQIITTDYLGSNQVSGVNAIDLLIPLRTSFRYDVTIFIDGHDANGNHWTNANPGALNLKNLTGSIDERILLFSGTEPPLGQHYWQLSLTIRPNSTEDCSDGHCALSYPMFVDYDQRGDYMGHSVTKRAYGPPGPDAQHDSATTFALWAEFREVAGAASAQSRSEQNGATTDKATLLLGLLLLAASFALAPVNIPLALGVGVLAYATIRAGQAGTGIEGAKENLVSLIRKGAAIAALASCAGAFIAPHPGAKIALGGACALLGAAAIPGGLPALLDFFFSIPEIVKTVAENVAAGIVWLIDAAKGVYDALKTPVTWAFEALVILCVLLLVRESVAILLYGLWVLCVALRNRRGVELVVAVEWFVQAFPVPGWDFLLNRYSGGQVKRGGYLRRLRHSTNGKAVY